ncbi:MAG: hypothetical protein U5K54_15050 [Cytophagales bacterium]|nr:hypothetical protein [Cytophagales bacterium]
MKVFTMVALCTLLFLAGCKKDDPIPEPTEQEIVTALLTAGTGHLASQRRWRYLYAGY